MEKSVLKFIKDNKLAEKGSRVGIALSGGPDSMALLNCFINFRKRGHFDICAVHLEHGIRELSSEKDAFFVAEQCQKLNIPLYRESANVPYIAKLKKISVESAGRLARDELFCRIVKEGKADVIATAHHADDNAESVLMHILRGSGISGLCGIKAKRGFLIRPFLEVRKADILNYIKKNNIPFCIDETNADNSYRRNYVRNVLINSAHSVFGDVAGSINRLSRFASADNDYIEAQADMAFNECAAVKKDKAEVDTDKLLTYHDAIISRVLIRALNALGIENDVESAHINALINIVKSRETGKSAYLLKGLGASIRYGKLIIDYRGKEFKPYSYRFKESSGKKYEPSSALIPGNTYLPDGNVLEARLIKNYNKENTDKFCECFDLDKLPENCTLRQAGNTEPGQPKDIIHPLGAPGRKKLNRYCSDKKIPARQRANLPVLADGNNIIWAIGVGISEDYKADESTKNIVQLKFRRKEN